MVQRYFQSLKYFLNYGGAIIFGGKWVRNNGSTEATLQPLLRELRMGAASFNQRRSRLLSGAFLKTRYFQFHFQFQFQGYFLSTEL